MTGGRGRPPYILSLLTGVALVVLPWCVRNAVVLGSPVVTTTHGGYTLLLANNPVYWREVVDGPPGAVWDGVSLDAWQRRLETDMRADGIDVHDELARDRWAKQRALGNIRNQPGAFLRGVAYRLWRFWDVAPAGADAGLPSPVRWLVAGYFVVVWCLAAVGLVRWLWRGWKSEDGGQRSEVGSPLTPSLLPSVLLIVAFVAVHAVYWTDARMRAPVMPAVALLAACSAGRQWRREDGG